MSKEESTIIKGIAIILMLTFHLWNPFDLFLFEDDTIGLYHREWAAFGSICVSIFVFLSGYGLEASNSCKSFSNFKKRIHKLYLEYWKVWIPGVLILSIFGYSYKWYEYLLEMIGLRSYINGLIWFISLYVELLVFKYLHNKIERLKRCPPQFLKIVTIISLIFGVFFSNFNKNPLLQQGIVTRFIEYLPCFLTGILAFRSGFFQKRGFSRLAACICIVLLILFRIWLFYSMPAYVKKYADAFIVPVVIYFVLCLRIPVYVRYLLYKLGKLSMFMWLVHGFYYVTLSKYILWPKVSLLILFWFVGITYIIALILSKFWNYLHLLKSNVQTRQQG